MKRIACFIIVIFCSITATISQDSKANMVPSVIPAPVELQMGTGHFKILPSTAVSFPAKSPETKQIAGMLSAKLAAVSGFPIPVREGVMTANMGNIILAINPAEDKLLGKEGYKLIINEGMINLSANTPAGLFYGVQTLFQVLPVTAGKDGRQYRCGPACFNHH